MQSSQPMQGNTNRNIGFNKIPQTKTILSKSYRNFIMDPENSENIDPEVNGDQKDIIKPKKKVLKRVKRKKSKKVSDEEEGIPSQEDVEALESYQVNELILKII